MRRIVHILCSLARFAWSQVTADAIAVLALLAICLLWLANHFGWCGFDRHIGIAVVLAAAIVGGAIALAFVRMSAHAVFGWRFQFSLRTLLLAVPACAIVAGWFMAEWQLARRRQELFSVVTRLGGFAEFRDEEVVRLPGAPQILICGRTTGSIAPAYNTKLIHTVYWDGSPLWLRRLLGREFFENVFSIDLSNTAIGDQELAEIVKNPATDRVTFLGLARTRVTDACFASVERMPELSDLDLSGTKITDQWLAHVARLKSLNNLLLTGTAVTDAGLHSLEQLPKIEWLSLGQTRITDAGMQSVECFKQLLYLELSGTAVGDAGLAHVKGLIRLAWLDCGNTRITDKGTKFIAGLTNLEELSLGKTKITDASIHNLAGLKKAERITLPYGMSKRGLIEFTRALPHCDENWQ